MNDNDSTTTVLTSDYDKLLEESRFLDALRAAGVDNWDGYDEAQTILEGWTAENE